jgi:hypothetical protein
MHISKINIGLYPVGAALLDYLSNRYDAVHASTYLYWYERSPLVKLAAAHAGGELTTRSAEKILRSYQDGEFAHIALDEIHGLTDIGVLSDCDDWLVFSDNFTDLILQDWVNDPISNLFLPGPDEIGFVAFYQPSAADGRGRLVVSKSPLVETRRQEPAWQNGDLPPYSDAMVPGRALTFVLPGEAEATIKQEMESEILW